MSCRYYESYFRTFLTCEWGQNLQQTSMFQGAHPLDQNCLQVHHRVPGIFKRGGARPRLGDGLREAVCASRSVWVLLPQQARNESWPKNKLWGGQINSKALVDSKLEYNSGNGQNNRTILQKKTPFPTDFNFQLALLRCSLASHLLTRLES